MFYSTWKSPVGTLTLKSDGKNLTGLWLGSQKFGFLKLADQPYSKNELNVFKDVKNWLEKYFEGLNPNPFDLPLDPHGTTFQKEVWNIVREISYGKVMSYGNIAKFLAKKRGVFNMAAQAVGGAVKRNPISIIIPCHRVVGSNGKLGGYFGGLDTKLKLLKLEGFDTGTLRWPRKG
jgi:methylated-DNA-[protein]-cysteine S-methyltransferase